MRKHLIIPALFLLATAYACSQTPVQPSAHAAQASADELAPDSTGRGGNVMGSGH